MSAHAKTDNELWLAGKRRHRPLLSKSTVAPGRPKCPSHLCESARKEFHRVSKLLGERKHESRGDEAIVALYAVTYDRWVRNKAKLDKQGEEITVQVFDNHGEPHDRIKENPVLERVERNEKQLFTLAKELGLTPQARAKVQSLGAAEPEKRVFSATHLQHMQEPPELFDSEGNYTPFPGKAN